MLSLSGIPGTVGFIAKFQVIHALVNGAYTWLAVVLVIGSMISLGYYLRVIATVWMRVETPSPGPGIAEHFSTLSGGLAPLAGGAPEADAGAPGAGPAGVTGGRGAAFALPSAEVAFVALVFAAATIGFGIFPSLLFDLAAHAGRAFTGLY
jgi:NADH-quinone oxidoreductase subunit N